MKIKIYNKKDNLLLKEFNNELTAITWLLMQGYIYTGHGWYFSSPEITVVREFDE